jgi:transcriptional regulator GlxA family with amidase domain
MTKIRAESASRTARLEVGLVCDKGTSLAGLHGMTDLVMFAGEMAQRRGTYETPAVRITQWRSVNGAEIRCVADSMPGLPPSPGVLIIPGNFHAPAEETPESPLVPWLRQKHGEGVVLAAVCGGVFILARTGLLSGRQATTHWGFSAQFAAQFPDILTETDKMVIDYGDVLTGGGVLAWADLGLTITERCLGPSIM